MRRFLRRITLIFLVPAFAATNGCSSPSRAPESDVVEVERIDLRTPEGAAGAALDQHEESLVLPGAAPAAAPSPAESVSAPESK